MLTDDKDYFKVIADARLKLAQDTARTMPCIEKDDSVGESQAVATSIDASESDSGACRTVKRQHLDHIAEKGYVGSFHYGLVHKPVSVQEAMEIPEAKAAVDKEWCKLIQKIIAWDVKKVRSKSEVIHQAKKDGKPVHFANLMDLGHVKNAELAKHLQNYIGRVVLWVDNVKDSVPDGSGKLLGHHLKAPWCGWRNK